MNNVKMLDLNMGYLWRAYGFAVAILRQGDWTQIVEPHRARWLIVMRPSSMSMFIAKSTFVDGRVNGAQVYPPQWRWIV